MVVKMCAKVINLKKSELNKLGYRDLEHWLNASDDHVYIGRDMTRYLKSATGSKWGNPFRAQDTHDRNDPSAKQERLSKYENHIRSTPELMNSLGELRGKCLGCWCAPELCHGHVLVKLLNETFTPVT